jgi:hypothetical protein
MTLQHPLTLAAALTATSVLLAACSSSPTHATKPAAGTRTNTTSSTSAAVVANTVAAPITTIPSTGPDGATSACALVTENDVTSTIGTDPGKGSAFSSHGATQCQYGSFSTEAVLVNLLPSLGKLSYDHILKDSKAHFRQIAGIGDGALENSGPHSDTIYFTKGDALVLVGISTATSPTKGAALALAKIAASRV